MYDNNFLLLGMFLGLESLALSSLTEDDPKWGPHCVDTRAPYASIISTIGTLRKGGKATRNHPEHLERGFMQVFML